MYLLNPYSLLMLQKQTPLSFHYLLEVDDKDSKCHLKNSGDRNKAVNFLFSSEDSLENKT